MAGSFSSVKLGGMDDVDGSVDVEEGVSAVVVGVDRVEDEVGSGTHGSSSSLVLVCLAD